MVQYYPSTPRFLLVFFLLIGIQAISLAQVTVKGIITDGETGETLIGVNVVEVGANNGTVSDFDGTYTLTISENADLQFTYIGYLSTTRKVNGAEELNVILQPDVATLNEVVVVGYGSQRKSDLTGSLSSVTEEQLKSMPVTGLDQALQGRAAGVYVTQNDGAPGGALSIRIRGIGSTLTAEPLYVIDGVPIASDNQGSSATFGALDGGGQASNALNTINPNDVERIEVLKDASATAIYGARAANGVVLITTKRGSAGKTKISIDSYVGANQVLRKLDVMNLREYAQYFGEINGTQLEEFERPELLGEGTDWQDAVFRTGINQNHQLSITGGNKSTQFAISGGFSDTKGIVVGSDFQRYSARVNLDHHINDRVDIGGSINVAQTNERIVINDNSAGVIYTALLTPPSAPVRNADGSFAAPQDEIDLQFDNPVARALETINDNSRTRVLSNLYFSAELFRGITYRTELGTDLNFSDQLVFFPSTDRGNFSNTVSTLNTSRNQSTFWINKHLLTFDGKIGESSKINTLFGFEAQASNYEFIAASRNGLPNNELTQINLGDAGQATNGGGAGHNSLVSWFSRVNYTLLDRYLFTATGRIDGSSRFGPNNRYGFFPSAAVAWRISEEPFFQDINLISNFKIRVGAGAVGNQEIGLYSYLANVQGFNVVRGDQLSTAFGPSNIANPNVRWESSIQANIGVDLGMYDGRITFTGDIYRKIADGMLLPAVLPTSAGGFQAPFVNIGRIVNDGLELGINTVNSTGAFSWSTDINASFNRNVVESLGSTGSLVGVIQRLPVTRTVEGRAISEFFGYKTAGIFQTLAEIAEAPTQSTDTRPGDFRFEDLNNDGVINEEDQTFLGNPVPDFTANLSNNFGYKGLELSFLIQGVFGNEILNLLDRNLLGLTDQNNQRVEALDRFTATNPSTTVPRATFSDPNDNRRISDRYVEDGSFVRLRNVNLGYQLPNALIKKINLSSAKVYVSGQNLLTFTEYSGYDPEVGSFNQNPLINGVDNGRYPAARSLTVGFNATF